MTTERHRFASLNFDKHKGDPDDGQIGEITDAPRVWCDGSAPSGLTHAFTGATAGLVSGCAGLPALDFMPDGSVPILCTSGVCLTCFSTALPSYDTVEYRLGTSGSWLPMVHSSGDLWTKIVSISGGTLHLSTNCGLSVAGCQGLGVGVQGTSGPIINSPVVPLSLSSLIYDYYAQAYGPYAGGHVQLRISHTAPSLAIRQACSKIAQGATSLSANWPAPTLAGSCIVHLFTQFGNDISGGVFGDPTTPSSFTKFAVTPSHRMTGFIRFGAPAESVRAIACSSAGDLQYSAAVELTGLPIGAILNQNVLDGQAASNNPVLPLTAPSTQPGIQLWAMLAHRSALASQAAVILNPITFHDASLPLYTGGPVTGGTLFETTAVCFCQNLYTSTPFTSFTANQVNSRQWDGIALNVH
jgi:hypothetical protein